MVFTLTILFFLLGLLLLWRSGPVHKSKVTPVDPLIPDDVEDYIWAAEAAYPDLIDGTEKHIEWAGKPLEKSEYSIVYIHGFSASRQECSPVCEIVAKQFDANLYFTRLTGHGRGSDGMLEGNVNDWYNDVLEAFRIGQKIGDKVIVVACSTGAALANWVQIEHAIPIKVMVQISPNYRLKSPFADLLTNHWGKQLAHILIGKEQRRPPEGHPRDSYWTPSYPVEALFPMIAVTQKVRRLNFARQTIPQLWLYSEKDEVVNVKSLKKVYRQLGSEIKQAQNFDAEFDPKNHLILGDLTAPKNTVKAAQSIVLFIEMVMLRSI